MKDLKIFITIFLILVSSRFIPHPPNFTSLIALSFYIPAILGLRYMPFLVMAFVITDFFIGFHSLTFFTWGSVLVIGLLSKYFAVNYLYRISGALLGACLFFIITNLGVWISGLYGYTFNGLLSCYILAIPFFGYTFISTLLYSVIIEVLNYYLGIRKKILNI
tara:strand:+ start:750 stop:1238 length:489 start_codon:yes stop_codon:yes gene_type:complete